MKKWVQRIKNGMAVLMILSMSITVMGAVAIKTEPGKVSLNGQIKEIPGGIIRIGDEVLLPIRWIATQMGGAEVSWDSGKRTVTIEVPIYSEEHRYLSYLNGLEDHGDGDVYPLPERSINIKWPEYPLTSNNPEMIHERPIGVTISDEGFRIPFAVYDYEIVDHKIYLGSNWLNTMFLAAIKMEGNTIDLTYMIEEELMKKIEEIEVLLKPRTPEEALNLWVRGQQVRSGSLQYVALSPELRQKVLERQSGWVTGGSSPSAGKVTVTEEKDLGEDTKQYSIKIDELLQGKVSGEVLEEIQVKKYEEQGQVYWMITKVSGDTEYFSILPE